MSAPQIYSADEPAGRDATEQEITDFLAGLDAADGTNYLDIYRASQNQEDQQ